MTRSMRIAHALGPVHELVLAALRRRGDNGRTLADMRTGRLKRRTQDEVVFALFDLLRQGVVMFEWRGRVRVWREVRRMA